MGMDLVTVYLKHFSKELQTGWTACVSSFNHIHQMSRDSSVYL